MRRGDIQVGGEYAVQEYTGSHDSTRTTLVKVLEVGLPFSRTYRGQANDGVRVRVLDGEKIPFWIVRSEIGHTPRLYAQSGGAAEAGEFGREGMVQTRQVVREALAERELRAARASAAERRGAFVKRAEAAAAALGGQAHGFKVTLPLDQAEALAAKLTAASKQP
jgi:hypothetical protein